MHVRKKLSRQETNKQQENKVLRGLESSGKAWRDLERSGKVGGGDIGRALREGYEEVWRGLEGVWHDLDISGGILDSWRSDLGLLLFPQTSTSSESWRHLDMNLDTESCTAETTIFPQTPPQKSIPNFHY